VKRALRTALGAALLLSTAGCKTVQYRTRLPAGGARSERTLHFFLFGAVGTATVDLTEACPNGVARWQNQKSFVDGLLTVVTIGIYTPRTVTIECALERRQP
jgi:hypothetical protein